MQSTLLQGIAYLMQFANIDATHYILISKNYIAIPDNIDQIGLIINLD